MKQTAVFDILQLGLIRVINCCSSTSRMNCTKPKTSGSMELEGGSRSHQLHGQEGSPCPFGEQHCAPSLPSHTFPQPHIPGASSARGLACSSTGSPTPPSTPGSPQVPAVPAAARPFGGAVLKTPFNCQRAWSIMQTNFTENEEKRKP